jgi:hypothetical protein
MGYILLLALFCWAAGLFVAWVVWMGVMALGDAWVG